MTDHLADQQRALDEEETRRPESRGGADVASPGASSAYQVPGPRSCPSSQPSHPGAGEGDAPDAVDAPDAPDVAASGREASGGDACPGVASTDGPPRKGGDAPDIGHPSRWVALGVLVLAVLLVALDSTVLGLAVPFLSEDLHPSGTQLLWIGDVYAFVLAGLLVSMGSLGDRVGRKKLLLCGAAAFGGVSALAAYAPTPGMMIAARATMGVAGAALMPSTLALIRTLFPNPRERSIAVGIWGAMTSAGAAVGPVLGGVLLQHFWWGSVFLVNLPVMALLLLGARLLPESRDPAPGPWDVGSVLLSFAGMLGVVYAVKVAATQGVRPVHVLVFAFGVLALVVFVRRQGRLRAPLLNVALFRDRMFSGAVLANLMTVLGLAGLVFFLSQFLQLVQHRTPLGAGLAQLPAAVGAVVAGLGCGVAARRAPVRVLVCGGLAAIGMALAAVVLVGPRAPYPFLGVVLGVCGLGAGTAYTMASDLVLSRAPKESVGAASAVSETAYELGAALGIALLGAAVTGIYQGFQAPHGTPDQAAATARESLGGAVEAAAGLPARMGHALLASAEQSFVSGLRVACAGSALLLFGTAVVAWFLLRDRAATGSASVEAGEGEA